MCDIENFLKYEDVVKKVLKKWPTKPITVFIDMKNTDRFTKKASGDLEDESDNSNPIYIYLHIDHVDSY